MSSILVPNFSVPLASSYNERGINGFTTTITNSVDQRKVNCMYEIVNNAVVGKTTIYLTKRPGISDSTNTLSGASTAHPYLAILEPTTDKVWMFSIDGSALKVHSVLTSTTIFTDGAQTWYPSYVDSTSISGTTNIVIQYRRSVSVATRTFYASDIGTWSEITDADFTGLIHAGKMEHLDGFAFQMAKDGYIYNSDINTLATWNPTNRIKKDIQQDVPTGLAKCNQLILAFSFGTVEVFRNNGNPSGSPLISMPQLAANIGIGAIASLGGVASKRHYAVTHNQHMYFLGCQAGANYSLGLFRFDGSQFNKVSTSFIDKIFAANTNYHVGKMSIYGRIAISITLTLVTETTQRWLMYFPDWNEWFEWDSSYVQAINTGEYYIGIPGVSSAKYSFFNVGDSTKWQDGASSAYTMSTQFMLKTDNSRKSMSMCGVLADTAASTSNLSVEFSDDDYVSWSAARNIDLASQNKTIHRNGSFRSRAVRLSHSANLECRIEKFLARIE